MEGVLFMMKKVSHILVFALLLTTAITLAFPALAETSAELAPATGDPTDPIVTITMTDGSIIKLELYPDIAPNTVANFVTLAESGYYNGLIFHRIIPGFMIQGGGYSEAAPRNPGYAIRGEFSQNGFENELKHERGVISMARTSDMNSAGSQFFIMHANAPNLDGGYAAFGKVIEGIEVVDGIARLTTADTWPVDIEHCTIKEMSVETWGIEYTVVKN